MRAALFSTISFRRGLKTAHPERGFQTARATPSSAFGIWTRLRPLQSLQTGRIFPLHPHRHSQRITSGDEKEWLTNSPPFTGACLDCRLNTMDARRHKSAADSHAGGTLTASRHDQARLVKQPLGKDWSLLVDAALRSAKPLKATSSSTCPGERFTFQSSTPTTPPPRRPSKK